MTDTFYEEYFKKAIEEKDLIRLKSYVISAIKNDPTFSGTEVNLYLNELHKNIKEIFVEKEILVCDETLPEDQWNEKYFNGLVYCFKENFCEDRLEEIKRVGKKVFGEKAKSAATTQTGQATQQPKSGGKKNAGEKAENPPKHQGDPKTRVNKIAIAAAIIVVIIALVLVIKKLL